MKNLRLRNCAIARFGRSTPQGGFSLVELLISLGITIVIVVAAAGMFDRSNRMAKVETSVTDAQQNARYASYQVVREARMAGAGGVTASIGSVQLGVTLSIGTSSYHSNTAGVHLTNNVNTVSDSVFISGSHHIKKGTDVLHVRGIISGTIEDLGTSSFDTATGILVIHPCTKFPDSTNTNACSPNGYNDVSSYSSVADNTKLFVMTDALGNVGVALIQHAVVAADTNGLNKATLTLDLSGNAYAKSLNSLGSFNTYLTTPTRGGVLDDLLYFVDDGTASGKTCGTANQSDNPGPCHPQLSVASWTATGAGCVVSASDPFACATVTPIADDVEDMQIAYGIDFSTMTCTGSGSTLSCTASGSLASQSPDTSISLTNGATFASIVKSAYGSVTTNQNQDPSEDTSTAGNDEWIGNVSGEIDSTGTTFGYASDLSNLKAIEVSILAKGTQPDPAFKGLGAKTWAVMDSAASTVSSQNGYAYHRRLVPVRVNLRNYQLQ